MHKKAYYLIVIMVLVSLVLGACGDDDKESDKKKTYNVGILVQAPTLQPVVDGFKAGLAEAGYTEGENIVYFYSGPVGTIDALKTEAEALKSKDLDLLFAIATPSAQTAHEVFADTEVAIVAAPFVDPVGLGLVESLRSPGGNLTGILSTDTVAKSIEWLLKIVPDAKRIYVPHVPEDNASVQSLASLTSAAETSGLELVVSEGTTEEELDAITQNAPEEDVDAVFFLRSGSLGTRIADIVQMATDLGVPVVCSDVALIDSGVMIGYGPGYPEMGGQAARLADQILKGADPGTLPVESAEAFLAINLQTAQAIGMEVSDEVLQQAYRVIRPESQ